VAQPSLAEVQQHVRLTRSHAKTMLQTFRHDGNPVTLGPIARRFIAALAALMHSSDGRRRGLNVLFGANAESDGRETLVRTAGLEPAREVTPEGF
jgi:hypothetical protein